MFGPCKATSSRNIMECDSWGKRCAGSSLTAASLRAVRQRHSRSSVTVCPKAWDTQPCWSSLFAKLTELAMFFDFDLGRAEDEPLIRQLKLKEAARLGFDCVVANHQFLHATPSMTAWPQNQHSGIDAVLNSTAVLTCPPATAARPLTLTRLTLIATTLAEAGALTASNLRNNFDIVAIQPLSEQSFQMACRTLDVDLIVLDLSRTLPFKLTIRSLQTAVKRGIHFELAYRIAVKGGVQARTVFFASVQMICKALKGRNVILSSSALQASELKGPYDIVNFATLFGLSEAQAKASITSRPEAVLRHAKKQQAAKPFSITALPHKLGSKPDEQPMDQAVARRKRGEMTSEQWSSKQGKSNLGPAGKKAKLNKSSGPQLTQEVIDLASSEDDATQK